MLEIENTLELLSIRSNKFFLVACTYHFASSELWCSVDCVELDTWVAALAVAHASLEDTATIINNNTLNVSHCVLKFVCVCVFNIKESF